MDKGGASMKTNKLDLKYTMIFLVIITGLLLACSGVFSQTTTHTAYRTTIDGEDSARVAKWDVIGVTKNRGSNIDLNVGFTQEVNTGGDWYFEIENKSEVAASINKSSTIKFRLMHSSFEDFGNTVSWDFLGTGKDNPVQFMIYAYNASADDLLTYKHKTTGVVLSYSEFGALSVQDKLYYDEIFTKGDVTEIIIADTDILTFVKKFEVVEGETVVFFEASLNMSNLTDAECNLGLGDNKANTTFRVHWTVGSESDNDTFYCYKCHAILNDQKNSGEQFSIGLTNWKCTACNNDLIIESFDTILNYKYSKYLISDTDTAIDGYTKLDGNFDKVDGIDQFIYKSNEGVDFFTYLKYTSSLGGQPMFEFLNSLGTQTVLVPFDSLTDDQRIQIVGDPNDPTKTGYSTTSGSARSAWERLTYDQYEVFERHNTRLEDNLAYMSYGVKLRIIFDITVEQVS